MPQLQLGWIRLQNFLVQAAMIGLLVGPTSVLAQDQEETTNQKPLRPAGNALRVDHVDPELLKILKDWEKSSAQIKRLEGEHIRWEYDFVFGIVKKNNGKFYYESPDKGRIDLDPDPKAEAAAKAKNGPAIEEKKHWENGKVLKFKVQAGNSERWICDGQIITQIDEKEKSATQIVIPPQNQGEHIIDGPLPFLFGMPAEKALRRFDLKLISNKNGKATIQAIPRWKQDASNYRLAQIILDLETFLPDAVRLIDPPGTKETVFKFLNLKKNSRSVAAWLGVTNPFKPNLKGYRVKVIRQDQQGGPVDQADRVDDGGKVTLTEGTRPSKESGSGKSRSEKSSNPSSKKPQPTVPSVIGLDWENAKKILTELGYEVSIKKGSPANRESQLHRVERQEPATKANLAPGETVTIWVYIKPKKDD